MMMSRRAGGEEPRPRHAAQWDEVASGGTRAACVGRVLRISRVVWDHVVAPLVLAYDADDARERCFLAEGECAWLLGLADALFPLVPRACRAVAGGIVPGSCGDGRHASRYFVLERAGEAGSARCIDWVLRSKATRNNTRECAAVIKGLCAGGHVGMAQELVNSGNRPWRSCALLRWPCDDPDLFDDLRDTRVQSLLYCACKGGHLESVKWVMSGSVDGGVGTEPWELVDPFEVALNKGHADVVKWLAYSTGAVGACKAASTVRYRRGWHPRNIVHFFGTPSLELLKLCTEWFSVSSDARQRYSYDILRQFVRHSPPELEEGCQWIKKTFAVEGYSGSLDNIFSPRAFRWMIINLSIQPTQKDFSRACSISTDDELVEWLLTNFSGSIGPVTPETFIAACANSVAVVRCLFPRTMPLATKHILKCLVESLGHSNISIAEWLDGTFHVMDHVNETPGMADSTLKKISESYCRCLRGLQWFLSRATLINISEQTLNQAFQRCRIHHQHTKAASALLKKFTVPVTINDVWHTASCGDISEAKLLFSHCSLSSEDVAKGLKMADSTNSGKVVRWLIQKFHLSALQVRSVERISLVNTPLNSLILSGKAKCAEWLIRKYRLPISDIRPDSRTTPPRHLRIWKMLMRVYPEMTTAQALGDFFHFIEASPLHIRVTTKRLGITAAEIQHEQYVRDHFVCFGPNATILMSSAGQQCPMKDLRVGDSVLAYYDGRGTAPAVVQCIWKCPVHKAIPMVIKKSKSPTEPKTESVLEITPDHPILLLSSQQIQPQQSLLQSPQQSSPHSSIKNTPQQAITPHKTGTTREWCLPTTLCEPHITHVEYVYNLVLEPQHLWQPQIPDLQQQQTAKNEFLSPSSGVATSTATTSSNHSGNQQQQQRGAVIIMATCSDPSSPYNNSPSADSGYEPSWCGSQPETRISPPQPVGVACCTLGMSVPGYPDDWWGTDRVVHWLHSDCCFPYVCTVPPPPSKSSGVGGSDFP
ncbi:hypothetical protein Pelo_8523 [Pelomyxa schiedti]|nr:hypothetical protein Pelo_8523 [Pelomyxa schiedti]